MARAINLSRDEAEYIVDMLEAKQAYSNVSSDLREIFGMAPYPVGTVYRAPETAAPNEKIEGDDA